MLVLTCEQDLLQSDSCPSPATTRATLELLLEIFKHIPASALLRRPSTGDDGQPSSTALQGPYSFACNFYNLTTNDARCREQPLTDVPFVAIFQALVQLNMSLSKDILGGSDDIMNSRVAYIHSVTLLTDLVDHLQHRQGGSPVINWDPTKWLSTALDCVSAKVCSHTSFDMLRLFTFVLQATSYPVVDSAITAIIQLHQADRLQPNFSIDQRATMTAMVEPVSVDLAIYRFTLDVPLVVVKLSPSRMDNISHACCEPDMATGRLVDNSTHRIHHFPDVIYARS